MKRLIIPLAAFSMAALPSASEAAGLYIEGFGGLTLLDDYELEEDSAAVFGADIKSKAGGNVGAALGVVLPLGGVDLRLEGEVAYRSNKVDEVATDLDGTLADDIEGDPDGDSITSAVSGMANGHVDFWILPQLALTAGAGVGYARVKAEIVADFGGVLGLNNIRFIDEDDETDTALAYQLMTGVRYDLGSNVTISAGYRYFATEDLEFDVNGQDGAVSYDVEYATHNFNLGLGFRF